MASFDEMINSLHQGNSVVDDGLSEPKGIITINDKRQFMPSTNFNPVIGYEGDVNSQIITFDLPATIEGHDLTKCGNKIIKWSNLQNGLEGRSKLEPVDEVIEGRQYLQWRVEPDVFAKAGTIQITISFYDKDSSGKVAFQWNTASFSGLSVAATDQGVGFFEPAENEVLFISEETRRIIAPQGYNNVVGNYGDIGVSNVYFRTKRKVRGIDLLDNNTVTKIRCNLNGDVVVYELEVTPYSTQIDETDGLVNIIWKIPSEITANDQNYAGPFSIEVDFETKNQEKVWRTSTYNGLIIGSDVFQIAEDYIKNPDRYYVLDGELYHDNVAYTVIGGTYLVKKFTEGRDIPLQDREIVAEYNEDGTYKELKIGIKTKTDGEDRVELQSVVPEAVTIKELNSLEERLGQSIEKKTITLSGDVTGEARSTGESGWSIETTLTKNYILTSEKGAANGVAELDENGKVPTSQLPSYVDDVLEYDKKASFPTTGETGKIYVAKDTNITYRWGGSTYTEISASLALGVTSDTAFRGDQGKAAYTHSTITSGNPHGVTYQDLGLTTEKWQLTIEGQQEAVIKNIVLWEGQNV